MKTIFFSFVQLTFTALLLAHCAVSFSQKSITWKGGTPGQENDWYCPKNWSASAVPDEFSNVFIPNVSTTTFATPVIRYGKAEVNSLCLEANALLTIEKNAQLVVFGHSEGINDRNLILNGYLFLLDEAAKKNAQAKISVTGKDDSF